MASKKIGVSGLYPLGAALTAIGFICPVFGKGRGAMNGFDLVTKNSSAISIGVILVFIGAIAAIILCFLKVKNVRLLKLVALVLSILGGVILVVRMNDNAISKLVGKGFLKHTAVGFYLILVGWILSLVGFIKSK